MFAAAEATAPEGFQLDVEISLLNGGMPRVDIGPGHLTEEIQEYHDVEEPPAPVPAELPTAQGEPVVLGLPPSAWSDFQSGQATSEVERREQLLTGLTTIQRQTESHSVGLLAGSSPHHLPPNMTGTTLGSVPAAEAARASGQMMSKLGYKPRSRAATARGEGDGGMSRGRSGILPTLAQLSSSSSSTTGINPGQLSVNLNPTVQVQSLTTHKERNLKWFFGPIFERDYLPKDLLLQVRDLMQRPEQDLEGIFLHERTRLAEGMEGLLVDPGAFDNLVGQLWVDRVRSILHVTGQSRRVSICKLQRTLAVEGVGNGYQIAQDRVSVPGLILSAIGPDQPQGGLHEATFESPMIPGSHLPALLGLRSLKAQRAILDMGNDTLWLCQPGHVTITPPSGSVRLTLETSASGHLILPFTAFAQGSRPEQANGARPLSPVIFHSSAAPSTDSAPEA